MLLLILDRSSSYPLTVINTAPPPSVSLSQAVSGTQENSIHMDCNCLIIMTEKCISIIKVDEE